MESKFLQSIIASRKAYNRVNRFVNQAELSDLGQIIYTLVSEYYEVDAEATECDQNILIHRAERNFPRAYEHIKLALRNNISVSPENVVEEWIDSKRDAIRQKLIDGLVANRPVEDLIEQYYSVSDLETAEEDAVFISKHPNEIISRITGDNLIKLFPKSLNDEVGGGVPLDSVVVVFARPDVGKTAYMINQVAGSLRNGLKVLYIGNEDPAAKILQRILARLTDMELAEMSGDPEKCYELARKRGYDNLVFVSASPGTLKEIGTSVEKYSPSLVIVDQMRNILSKEDGKVAQLEEVAKGLRSLAKKHHVVIFATTQAGDSAEGRLALTMSDLDSSKTGVPGQADLLIGLGADQNYKNSDRLMVSICKNKVNGSRSVFPVRIHRGLSKISS